MEIIKLNLIPSGVNPTCHCSQYDNGRVIRIELFESLTPYVLQSGDTVTLNVRKPDNTIVTTTVETTQGNNYVDIVTTEQICAVVGYNLCDLTITNGSVVIGTLNFIMQVERDVIADGVDSQSVIKDLQEKINQAVDNSEPIVDNRNQIKFIENTIEVIDYAYRDGFVDGYLNTSGQVVAGTTQGTINKTTDFIEIRPSESVRFYGNNGSAFTIIRCVYNSNKVFTNYNTVTATNGFWRYYNNTSNTVYLRASFSTAVSETLTITKDNYIKTVNKVERLVDEMNDKAISLNMGIISPSGEETVNTANFKTADFLPITISKVECASFYDLAVCTYLLDGTFSSRSAWIKTFSAFDNQKYKYKVTYKRSDGGSITDPDYDNVYFYSYYRDTLDTFNKTANVKTPLEQGNINYSTGANQDSANNLRTIGYLPENLKSVSTTPDYIFCIAKYNKSSGAFINRSQYQYTYFDDFDFTTYKYRVGLAQAAQSTPIDISEGKYLYFNTATLDIIRRNGISISQLQQGLTDASIPLLNNYLNMDGYSIIARALRGIKTSNAFIDNGFTISDSSLKSHDATMCIYNDTMYIVRAMFATNDNAQSDDCKIVLTTCSLTGANIVNIDVAKQGDTLGGYSIAGGCGSPNLYLVGTTIHILFTAHTDTTFVIFHCTYDISTGTIGNYAPIKVNNEILTVDVASALLGQTYTGNVFNAMQMNASIAEYAGNYYAGLCAGTNDTTGRGAVLYSSDFVNWSVFVVLDKKIITPVYELACWAGASGTNGLFIMTRSGYNKRKGYYAKYRISDKVLREECYILNGCTRPDFVYFNNNLLLLNTEDGARNVNSIITINTDNIFLSKMTNQAYRYTKSYQYLRGFVYNNTLYGVCTITDSNNRLAIHVNTLNVNPLTDATIQNALDQLVT